MEAGGRAVRRGPCSTSDTIGMQKQFSCQKRVSNSSHLSSRANYGRMRVRGTMRRVEQRRATLAGGKTLGRPGERKTAKMAEKGANFSGQSLAR